MKTGNPILFSSVASLWNGQIQLEGKLILTSSHLTFQLKGFKASHLVWQIPTMSIEKVEEFLVFDIARKGIRILGKSGKSDLFVLEDVQGLKEVVTGIIRGNNLLS